MKKEATHYCISVQQIQCNIEPALKTTSIEKKYLEILIVSHMSEKTDHFCVSTNMIILDLFD